MTRKNTCIACPTNSKAWIALLLLGFTLIFVPGMKITGIAMIALSYIFPFIKSRISKKR